MTGVLIQLLRTLAGLLLDMHCILLECLGSHPARLFRNLCFKFEVETIANERNLSMNSDDKHIAPKFKRVYTYQLESLIHAFCGSLRSHISQV